MVCGGGEDGKVARGEVARGDVRAGRLRARWGRVGVGVGEGVGDEEGAHDASILKLATTRDPRPGRASLARSPT